MWNQTVRLQINSFLSYLIQPYIPITLYPTAPLYNILIIYDTILRKKRNFKHEKKMNSTVLPPFQFDMRRRQET